MARKKRQAVSDGKSDERLGPDFAGSNEIGSRDANGLTPRQAAFVKAFVSGPSAGDAKNSGIAAGYSAHSAHMIACGLQKLPHVIAAIDQALREEMGGALTAQAVKVIRAILKDENAPLKLRGDMACKVVEFSGIVERVRIEKAKETGLDGMAAGPKRLGEMTRPELEAMVRNGAAILQAAAALPPVAIDAVDASKADRPKPNGFGNAMVSMP